MLLLNAWTLVFQRAKAPEQSIQLKILFSGGSAITANPTGRFVPDFQPCGQGSLPEASPPNDNIASR